MKLLILITLSFLSLYSAYANSLPQTKEDFCTRFNDRPEDRETIQDFSTDSVNLMGFKNHGGLFNGGTCWWHSRFQRNAFYLSIFNPFAVKPNTLETKKIIHQLRLGTEVVIVPGFVNFEEFTSENKELIQKELNDWQLYDGIINGGWIDGLSGNTKVKPTLLKKMMNDVYNYVAIKKKVAYEKLQIKGIMSHAWLIVGIKKMPSGYDVGYIDSNKPNMTNLYSYKDGDSSFYLKSYGNFVPYLEFKREEERLYNAGKVFCGLNSVSLIISRDQTRKDYQEDLKEAKKINPDF